MRAAGKHKGKEGADGENSGVRGPTSGDAAAACWSLVPNKLNGTTMSKEEFFDNARLRYGWKPVDMCERCDGCNAPFTVEHALGCKKGGLVVQRHDDTRDEAGALAEMALTTSRVTYEPYIFHNRDVSATLRADEVRDDADSEGEEARGDVAIHGLWERGKTCILDVRITDTDAKAHFGHSSEKVLEKAAKEKKKKYNDACLARRRTFCPLVYLADGMACKEALAFKKRIAGLLCKKMDQRYNEMVVSHGNGCVWPLSVRTPSSFVETGRVGRGDQISRTGRHSMPFGGFGNGK